MICFVDVCVLYGFLCGVVLLFGDCAFVILVGLLVMIRQSLFSCWLDLFGCDCRLLACLFWLVITRYDVFCFARFL